MKKFASLLSLVLLAGVMQGISGASNAGQGGNSQSPSTKANPIRLENQKTGDRGWQLTNPAKSHEIEGYASAVSVNRGDSISFFVNTADLSYHMDIYRMGWYGGAGARRMLTIVATGTRQPAPQPDRRTGLVECKWTNPYVLAVSYSATDPTLWASGIYLAKLTGASSRKQSYIIFVVRDDARPSDLLLQDTVTTYEAYNTWGGLSLYKSALPGFPLHSAYKVSFDRPYYDSWGSGDFFYWEYQMVRFLEREGYDVSYSTDLETHLRGDLLLRHKALLIVGHDEYWSWQMRDNVEAARGAGINLGFFSSNTAYWQVRFEPATVTGEANRTMVCYKHANLDPYYTDGNPDHQHLVTVMFRRPPVNRPEDALQGVMFDRQTFGSYDLVISDAHNWIFANTGLQNGSHLIGLLGYEADRLYGNAPTGTVRVAHSQYPVNGVMHYSDMTAYTWPSGSTVVATGTMQWSWGVDDYNRHLSSSAVQQATRNILAKFVASAAAR